MGVNLDVVGTRIVSSPRSWTSKDTLLYALGVGAGEFDPTGSELMFTTENSLGVEQKVLPTFPAILGQTLRQEFDIGDLDFRQSVHGEQIVRLHREIPVEGTVTVTATVRGIYDKGSGCLIDIESTGDLESGPLYLARSCVFVRGAGGFGGPRGSLDEDSQWASVPIPARNPDHVVRYATRSDQPLLYRLSGDRNPLHSDPEFARRLGFEGPILHGLCTYGFTGRALLHALCDSDPARFGEIRARFTRPVIPGEELVVSIWDNDSDAKGSFRFETSTGAGDTVIAGGLFLLR
jgi:acyl dehydratase